jgi:hypothetical protein
MSKAERIARNFWTAGWAVLFVCGMTVLSEMAGSPSGDAASSVPPHFFSAKSAASVPAQQ